jgi:predicted Zn finger-like uncharacterized protein
MHVSCPNCKTKYNLADAMMKPGAKAKCTKCGHLFPLGEPAPPPKPAEPDGFDVDIDADLENEILGGFDDTASGADQGPGLDGLDDDLDGDLDAPPAPKRSAAKDDDGISFDDGELDGSLGFDLDGGSKKKGKKGKKKAGKGGGRKGLLIVLVLLLLVGGGAAGVWFFVPHLLPFGPKAEQPPADQGEVKTDVISTKKIKDIVLLNVKQYVINNEKVGQMVVIEGKVVNNFPTPKELIKVQASMFDDNGVVVASSQMLCGNTLSLYQLQTFSQPEIDDGLGNKVGILTNNTNIQPGGDVPFMIVFPNPPATATSFGVDVIEAKDPPKE